MRIILSYMLEWMLQEEQREPRAFRRRARRWRHPSSQRDFRRPTRCERESWRRPRGRHHPPWQELTTLAWRGGSRRTWSKRKMWRVEWMLGPHGVQNWRNVTSCRWLINEAESVNGSCYVLVRCLVYIYTCFSVGLQLHQRRLSSPLERHRRDITVCSHTYIIFIQQNLGSTFSLWIMSAEVALMWPYGLWQCKCNRGVHNRTSTRLARDWKIITSDTRYR